MSATRHELRRPTRLSRWLAVASWVGGAAALLSSLALLHGVVEALPGRFLTSQDLAVYHAYGVALRSGLPLYEVPPTTSMPFTYPPFSAWLLAPLSLLPLADAARALLALSLAALGVLSWVATGAAGVRGPLRPGAALALTALLPWTEPVQFSLLLGQVNVVVVLLVAADLTRPRGSLLRGVGAGVAAGVKLTPGLFLVHLLVVGDRRALALAVGGLGATVAVGALLSPTDSLAYLTGGLAGSSVEAVTPGSFSANQSLRGVVVRSLGRDSGTGVTLAWLAAVLAALVLGLAAARAAHRAGERLLAVSAVGLTTLLVSPVSWTHHWVWLPLAAVAVVGAGTRRGRASLAAALALAAGVLAVLATYPSYRNGVYEPTGVTWLPPWNPFPDGDRPEFRWGPVEVLLGNAYVLTGVAVLLVVLAVTRRARAPRPVEG